MRWQVWDYLIKKLQSPELVGAVSTLLAAVIGKVVADLGRQATARWTRKDGELERLNQRKAEEQEAAKAFAKDARDEEIKRLERMLAAKTAEAEAHETRADIFEEANTDLQLELAQSRVREATGKHRALPPNPIHRDDQPDTVRPRKR